MTDHIYKVEVTIMNVVKQESNPPGNPNWTIKVGEPFFLSWTVDKEPLFKAGAKGMVILAVPEENVVEKEKK